MLTAIGWILQVVFLIVFFLWGYLLGKRHGVAAEKEKDNSICSCTHKYSMHDENGKCNVFHLRRINHKDREVRCACVRYDGVPPAHIYLKDV